MKVAVMQPYLFPYIGYWQLVGAVDAFVLLDDVNYIVRGYINRNTIIVGGKPHRFSLELQGASQNRRINEIQIGSNARKILRTIELAYKRAPFFGAAFPVIERALLCAESNLARYVGSSILGVSAYLGIEPHFFTASQLGFRQLHGQERILHLCRELGATDYINPIGGMDLYDADDFAREGIRLSFLRPHVLDASNQDSESLCSIMHLMMHFPGEKLRQRLSEYTLV